MNRAYYKNSILDFIKEDNNSILGQLSINHSNRQLEDLQKNAWLKQIVILKDQLRELTGQIYFEFAIPRMGKRVDNVVILENKIFLLEFKVGDQDYKHHDQEQVLDYTLDLKNFHEGSHDKILIPVLVSTNANKVENLKKEILKLNQVARTNKEGVRETLFGFLDHKEFSFDYNGWEMSTYKPTPTIVEAAKALYKGHSVEEISRSDSGAINLSKTANCLNTIIENAKINKRKAICFVTGVPGAGKTLAGLNIANERMKADEDEHAVFLSGNGPLVEVLREALARDVILTSKKEGGSITKNSAKRKTNAFIQNIHHFRDECIGHKVKPIEKVVVFDEAQRAWNKNQVNSFMKRKRGIENFNMSEPEFLIDVMDRHDNWCVIICLIGGGQEINTGEAGLEEWVSSLKKNYSNWDIHFSSLIVTNRNYVKSLEVQNWLTQNAYSESELHLSVSVRSFRSEKLAAFVHNLLELNFEQVSKIFDQVNSVYPIVITRNLYLAKNWLKSKAKGTERIGIIASSEARRLRTLGIDVKNEISAPNWFLNGKTDVRSSYFLEEIATEFDIQGLEIDWTCLAWGANFYLKNNEWSYQNFKGTKWQNINKDISKEYLKNTYRVLLTRARQGLVIFIPEGSNNDMTRKSEFYDGTYDYLKKIGLKEIK